MRATKSFKLMMDRVKINEKSISLEDIPLYYIYICSNTYYTYNITYMYIHYIISSSFLNIGTGNKFGNFEDTIIFISLSLSHTSTHTHTLSLSLSFSFKK